MFLVPICKCRCNHAGMLASRKLIRHEHRNACSRCLLDDGTLESVPGACSARCWANTTEQELCLERSLWLQVLIISYETFRLHAERFAGDRACDLLICDEAHRLKSDQTLTSKVISCAMSRTTQQDCCCVHSQRGHFTAIRSSQGG